MYSNRPVFSSGSKPLRINDRSESLISNHEVEKKTAHLKRSLSDQKRELNEAKVLITKQQKQIEILQEEVEQLKEAALPFRDDYDFELKTFGFKLGKLMAEN